LIQTGVENKAVISVARILDILWNCGRVCIHYSVSIVILIQIAMRILHFNIAFLVQQPMPPPLNISKTEAFFVLSSMSM
jgi:hypothetical protein